MARAHSAGTGTWMDHLPFVLLGLRTAIREDSGCSPAELLFGTSLRLPGDLLDHSEVPLVSPSDFVADLRSLMHKNSPMPFSYHGNTSSQVPAALASCSHVFLRVDAVRRPLCPPYDGPFAVLQRGPKTFIIDKNGKTYTVTVDRLKPASPFGSVSDPLPSSVSVPTSALVSAPVLSAPAPSQAVTLDPEIWPLPTRSGRQPRPVVRYGHK